MRSLSPEEAELWARVAATIAPLSRDVSSSVAERGGEPPKALDRPKRLRPLHPSSSPPPRRSRDDLGRSTLDAGWDRRLRSGAIDPDRTLDLHGMSLDTAWRAIDRALDRAIVAGERVVLLITGHHRPGDPPVERGRIRAAVHDWLAASRHSGRIAAVRDAHRRHGGGGSLYVILRRPAR